MVTQRNLQAQKTCRHFRPYTFHTLKTCFVYKPSTLCSPNVTHSFQLSSIDIQISRVDQCISDIQCKCGTSEPQDNTRSAIRSNETARTLTIWLISVIGTFGGGLEEPADEVIDWFCGLSFLGGVGGGGVDEPLFVVVTGCTLTLHSFELRLGEIRDGKLKVFVHCDKLRTIFSSFAPFAVILLLLLIQFLVGKTVLF